MSFNDRQLFGKVWRGIFNGGNDCKQLFSKGVSLLEEGKREKARKVFARCLRAEPEEQQILTKVGGILCDYYGEYDLALSTVERALNLNEDDPIAMTYKGVILRHLGRFSDALELYDKALTASPGFIDALVLKGALLTDDLARQDDALRIFNHVLRLDPKNVECWWNISQVYLRLEKPDSAIAAQNKIIELDSDRIDVLESILNLQIIHSKPIDALRTARRIMETDPRSLKASFVIQTAEFLNDRLEFFAAIFALVVAFKPNKEFFDELGPLEASGPEALAEFCIALIRGTLAEAHAILPEEVIAAATSTLDESSFNRWLVGGGAESFPNLLMGVLVSYMLHNEGERQLGSTPSKESEPKDVVDSCSDSEKRNTGTPTAPEGESKMGKDEANALFEKGVAHLNKDRSRDALRCFEAVLEYFTHAGEPVAMISLRINMAQAFLELGDHDMALLQCRQGAEQSKGDVPAHVLGWLLSCESDCLFHSGRQREAIETSKKALKLFLVDEKREDLLHREIRRRLNMAAGAEFLLYRLYIYCISALRVTSRAVQKYISEILDLAGNEDEDGLRAYIFGSDIPHVRWTVESIMHEAKGTGDTQVVEYIENLLVKLDLDSDAEIEEQGRTPVVDATDLSGEQNGTNEEKRDLFRLITAGIEALDADDFRAAMEAADQIIKDQNNHSGTAVNRAAAELCGPVGWRLVQSGDPARGIAYLDQAFVFSQKAGDINRIFTALDCLGYGYSQLERYDEAIQKYYRLISLAGDTGFTDKIRAYLPNLAESFRRFVATGKSAPTGKEDDCTIGIAYELESAIHALDEVASHYSNDQWQEVLMPMINNFIMASKELLDECTHLELHELLLRHWRDRYLLGNDAYAVLHRAEGGMGEVLYVFEVTAPFRAFVIKRIKQQIAGSSKARDRIVKEAHIWMEIPSHPNVAQILAVVESNHQVHLVCAPILGAEEVGGTLRSMITDRLRPDLACKLALEICAGMDHAARSYRKKGRVFVHLDLKPENILIDTGPTAKIADFGISSAVEENQPIVSDAKVSPGVAGTPQYMSPEQCSGEWPYDIRSDIYSFGCLFYEMLTGSPLFEAFDVAGYFSLHINSKPDLSELSENAEITKFTNIIARCCQKNRNERYRDFAEVGEHLAQIGGIDFGRSCGSEPGEDERSLLTLQLARNYVHTNDIQRAISLFDELQKEDPYNIEAIYGKAICMKRLDRYEEAEALIDKILACDPGHRNAREVKSGFFAIRSDFEQSLKILNDLLKEEPTRITALIKRGGVLISLEWFEDALHSFQRVIDEAENNAEARLGRFQALISLRRVDEAKEDFEWLSETSSRSPFVAYHFQKTLDGIQSSFEEMKEVALSLPREVIENADPEAIENLEKYVGALPYKS